MPSDFKVVSQKEFDSVVESIDKRRYKVTRRCEGNSLHWYFMPIQRRGLYRSAIRDVDRVLFAIATGSVYSVGKVPE